MPPKFLNTLARRALPERLYPRCAELFVAFRFALLGRLYAGDAHECLMCGGRFRRFFPAGIDYPVLEAKGVVGGGRRADALCPRCHSTHRERLVYHYLREATDLFQERRPFRLLHVAPEPALRRCLARLERLEYLTADLYSPLADLRMDVQAIPFPEASFDGILANHVLEHVVDDRKAMGELYRVLRPDGWAVLQVPIAALADRTEEDPLEPDPRERERRFGQHDHVRLYGRDYADRLRSAGFVVDVLSFTRECGEAAARRYALDPREELYFCRKE